MSSSMSVSQNDQAPVTVEPCSTEKLLINQRAPNVSFYTPVQDPPAGTPWDPQPDGALFSPFKITNMTLHNRIIVSPMCQYSSHDCYMNQWHHVHLGTLAVRGPDLVLTEVIAVSPEGRISPQDLGIWKDDHIDFATSDGRVRTQSRCQVRLPDRTRWPQSQQRCALAR